MSLTFRRFRHYWMRRSARRFHHGTATGLSMRPDARTIGRGARRWKRTVLSLSLMATSVGFKIDFDMALLVIASGLYRLMARRMRGYDDAQARQIFRDLIDMPADIAITESQITVRFHRRAHLPIVLASGLIDKPVAVPWWNGRALRLVK